MRKIAFGLVFFLLVVAAGWTALWVYVSNEAGRQVDAWLKAEAAQGRIWTCPNRAVGGYPFGVTVTCAQPTFSATARDQTVRGSLAQLVAGMALFHPQRVDLTLVPPFAYKTSDGKADVRGSWSRFTVSLDSRSITLHASDPAIDGNFGDTGRQSGNASALDAMFEMLPPATNEVLGFTVGVRGASVPEIDVLLQGEKPVDIDLAGQIDHANADNARTPEQAIERWREAGGRIDLTSSRISHADSSVTGAGTLSLDGAHRLQGQVEASFVGLEPVLKRYGISGNIAAAGSLLNSLFGGGPKQPQPQSDPNALTLPISFKGGRLGIGPIRTPIVLPPLY